MRIRADQFWYEVQEIKLTQKIYINLTVHTILRVKHSVAQDILGKF